MQKGSTPRFECGSQVSSSALYPFQRTLYCRVVLLPPRISRMDSTSNFSSSLSSPPSSAYDHKQSVKVDP